MKRSVMISINPKWCEKIAAGQKQIEIRKTRPTYETPFKCYIYQTKKKWYCSALRLLGKEDLAEYLEENHGQVIGEFVCDRIHEFQVFENGSVQDWFFGDLDKSCLSEKEIMQYIGKGKYGFSWRIIDLIIYDKPKQIQDFFRSPPCTYWHPNTFSAWDGCSFPFSCKEIENTKYCQGSKLNKPPQSWCYVEELT